MKKGKRILSFLLAMFILMGVVQPSLIGLTVYAAPTSLKLATYQYPRGADANYDERETWGHGDMNLMGGWVRKAFTKGHTVYADSSKNVVYCIEPGVDVTGNVTMTDKSGSYWENYPDNKNITISPDEISQLLGRVLYYGYRGTYDSGWRTTDKEGAANIANVIATQHLVWEVVVGERDAFFNKVDASQYGKDNVMDAISTSHTLYDEIMEKYEYIETSVQSHFKLPSFMKRTVGTADSYTLAWDGSKYSITLTDTNNVLGNYTFSSTTAGVTFSVNGNKLTVSMTTAPKGAVTVSAERKCTTASMVVWGDGKYGSGEQDVVAWYGDTVTDPVFAYVGLNVANGAIKVVKTSEDNKVSGISFTVSGKGVSITKTTNANGEIDFSDLVPGTYTITERPLTAYKPVASQTIIVIGGQTKTVTFHNELKTGEVVVNKTSDDGVVKDVEFNLSGTSTSGATVSLTAKTDANGVAIFKDVPVGTYTIREINVPAWYVAPEAQTVVVKYNEQAEADFHNKVVEETVTVKKTSEDGKVEGFKFRLTGTSAAGTSVSMTVITDANGVADFGKVPAGTYTVEEVNVPGYYVAPQNQNITVANGNPVEVSFHNALKKGSLSVKKNAEDGKISGITFKLSGTAENGAYVELTAQTNSNGVALFENVPIGNNYTVEEVGTGNYYIEPAKQSVTITHNEITYKTFDNLLKRGEVEITKTSEDGKVEGVKFHLFGTSTGGARVDEYAVTDANGVARFTDIPVGTYTVEEVETKDYYVVPANQSVAVKWNEVAEKAFHNELKRGGADVVKTSEDGKKEGFKFHLYGTSASGEVVDMFATTDKNGVAEFKNVLVGDYTIEEVDTPDYYIAPESQSVSVRNGATVEVKFHNALKRSEVGVFKTAEDNKVEGVKFRLYGTSLSGQAIDITAVTDSDGQCSFGMLPLGTYTVEEVDTPDWYIAPTSRPVVVEAGMGAYLPFHNELKKGDVKVTKTAEDGFVEGVKFRLFGTSLSGAEVNLTVTTNADGVAVFEDVLIGSYTIEEVNTKDYYIVPAAQSVTVEWNKIAEKAFHNELKRGGADVVKTSEDGKNEGFKFHLFGTSASGEVVDMFATTDKNGVAEFKNVLVGDYTIEEVETPDYYITPEAQSVSVRNGATVEVKFHNALKRGDVKVTKTAEDGLVEGIKFRLFGTAANGTKVDVTAVTNENGIIIFKDVLTGTYTIEEVDTADRYIVPLTQSVTVKWGEVAERTFNNALKYGSVSITKTAEDGKVEGVKFRLFGTSLGGAEVELFAVTDSDGIAVFENVLIGTYTIEEVDTNDRYIVLDAQNVTVKWNEVAEKSFHNALKRGSVTVTKTSEDGFVENVSFRLFGTSLSGEQIDMTLKTDASGVVTFADILIGTYTIEEVNAKAQYIVPAEQSAVIKWNEVTELAFNNELKKGDVKVTKTSEDGFVKDIEFRLFGTAVNGAKVDITIKTDAQGIAVFKDILIGSYTIEEVNTKDYYIVPAAQSVTVEWNKVAEKAFYNALKRGSADVVKTSEDGKNEGFKFHLFGTSASGIQVDMFATTDKNGVAKFENVLIGDYTIEEVETPAWYITPEAQSVSVRSGATVEVKFHNALKRGEVKVVKTAEDGKVEGVKFRLFGTAANGTKVDVTVATNAEGIAVFENILIGDYTVEEIEGEAYYIIPADQEATVEWNKASELSFHNELKKGDVKVTKTAEDGLVEGIKFRLFGTAANGTKVDITVTTNAQGVAIFKNILVGNYTIEEVDTADRYIVPLTQRVTVEWKKETGSLFGNVLKRGDIIGKKLDEDGSVITGALFGLFSSTETKFTEANALMTATSNGNGVFTFEDVPYGEWIVREIKPASGFVLNESNYPVAIKKDGEVVNITVENKFITGTVETTKVDERYPENKLTGAIFEIYADVNGNDTFDVGTDKLVGALTETAAGVYSMSDLRYGGYFLYEKTAPAGYVKDNGYYHFHITENGKTVIVENKAGVGFVNQPQRGSVKVTKTAEDGLIEGVTFRLYGTSLIGEKVDVTAVTNAEGVATFENILVGEGYVLEEVNTKDYYIVPAAQSVTVEWNKVAEKAFHNTLKRGSADVIKTSEDGKKEGFKFHLFGTSASGIQVDMFATTDKNGVAKFENVLIGDYIIEEVETPAWYIAPEAQSVSVRNGATVEVKFHNALKRGAVTVTKSSEDGKIEGVEFRLFGTAANGTKVDIIAKTNAEGVAVFKDILVGSYTVEEVNTNDYYIVPDKQDAVVEWNKTSELAFQNALKKGSVTVTKEAEDGIHEGVVFHLYGISDSGIKVDMLATTNFKGVAVFENVLIGKNYILEEVDTADRYIIPAAQSATVEWNKVTEKNFTNELKRGSVTVTKTAEDGFVEGVKFRLFGISLSGEAVDVTAVTNAEGIAVFENVLIGTYTIEEVDTADRYVTPDKQDVVVEWNKETGKSFENIIKRGTIMGKKLDEDGFAICGSIFGLFREGETVFTEETAVMTAISNEIGVFGFENVPYGRWLVREIKPADAFVLNENSFAVTVAEDGEVLEIVIENKFITGVVETTKVDKEYPDNKLTGAIFEIYADVDGDKLFNADIDVLVGQMKEVDKGVYRMADLRYNGYFLHEQTAPEGFLKDDGYYYFEIREDGKTVIVENEAGVGFANQPIKGRLEITKTDVADGKLLPGAGFEIRNEQGEIVVQGYTDENGVASFELRYGKYTYREFEAPDGYTCDAAEYPFEIKENGEIVKAAMTNEKVPETGDSANIGLWAAMLAASSTMFGLMMKKKSKENEA